MRRNSLLSALAGVSVCLLGWWPVQPAWAVNWDAVKPYKINVFYPGQRSWEFMLSQSEHSGSARFLGGKNCRNCHEGEEINFGRRIAKAMGVARPPHLELGVRAVHDGQNLHVRLDWNATGFRENPPLDKDNDSRVTMMLVEDSNRLARRAGCWTACHDDLRGMASFKKEADRTMYLPVSRTEMTRQGGGNNFKPPKRIQKLLDANLFLEYWQVRLNPGQPVTTASGWILEERHYHAKPVHSATGSADGTQRSVVITRHFAAKERGSKTIKARGNYMVGFAIHDGFAAGRHHYVSYERSMGFDEDEEADFYVQRQ